MILNNSLSIKKFGTLNAKLDLSKIEVLTRDRLWFIPFGNNEYYQDWNQICAITDQINLCVRQITNLNSNANYDTQVNEIIMFFTYGYILINSIDKLFTILHYETIIKYKNSLKSSEVFNNTGIDGRGNDYRYFKYLRSLIAGHPIETDLDKSYVLNGDKHFSPYIQRATGSNVKS